MKITALAVILCISVLAWYNYPDPPPAANLKIPEPIAPSMPLEPLPAEAGPERLASNHDLCRQFENSAEWEDLQEVFPGMSDTALCDFVLAPDLAKLSNVNVNPEAVEDLLNRLMSTNDHSNDYLADVPDLRYYLDPQAIETMRGLSRTELLEKINTERSAEAAYWLAHQFHDDEQSFVLLMLSAASYARKPGPLLDAVNGCCGYSPNDPDSERAAAIKREALSMIARELDLPEAKDWPQLSRSAEITAEVLEQRAAYVAEINHLSMQAYGEEWIK